MNPSVDNSVPDAIKRSGKISLTKNIALPEQNIQTNIVARRFENGNGKNNTCVWPEFGYFKQQPCDFGMEKEDHPEDSIIYINQGYLIIKDNKRLYYVNFYILGQVMECLNPPEDISNYVCQDREVKVYRLKYDIVTRKCLGLYETLGYLSVRSDPNEHFSDYGFVKRTQKYYILIIKEGFQVLSVGHFFNRCKVQFESGGLQTTFSKVYYFLPSTTDRSEEINRHLRSVNLSPNDVLENTFETENNVVFDP